MLWNVTNVTVFYCTCIMSNGNGCCCCATWNKTCKIASTSMRFVLRAEPAQDVMDHGSLGGVLVPHGSDQCGQFTCPHRGELRTDATVDYELGVILGGDMLERFLQRHDLVKDQRHGVNVGLLVVRLALGALRAHVSGRSHLLGELEEVTARVDLLHLLLLPLILALVLLTTVLSALVVVAAVIHLGHGNWLGRQDPAHVEVEDLDSVLAVEADVVWLDVSVHDAVLVQMLDGLSDLLHHANTLAPEGGVEPADFAALAAGEVLPHLQTLRQRLLEAF
mmetsp:Transcript_18546/g.51574  ORF Transcript_18546/g.51574 Transcript_18546/m.51574 type:complete len:278 (-) Transcript_18546:90-923(-)